MKMILSAALIAGAALLSTATVADAQMAKPTPKATTTTKTMTTPKATMTSKTSTMAPKTSMMAPKATMTPATKTMATKTMSTTKTTGTGRMVQAKLANGKTVTYNCSLPGNASKKACK